MPTVVQKTIKASGGDYVSMFALEAANANLVSLDQAWEVTCDNIDDTTAVNFNGWVTDATRYLKIKSTIAHGATGRVTTNSYRLTNSNSPLQMTAIGAGGLVIFEGIQFKCANANVAIVNFGSTAQAGAKVRFVNCVFENTGYGFIVAGSNLPVSSEIINCIFLCGKNCINRQFGSMWLYGCTFVSITAFWPALDFVADDLTTRVIKNCYAKGAVSATAYVNMTGVTRSVAMSHDATTGTVVSILYDTNNFNNVTAGTENLIPKALSALLLQGASREADVAPFNYLTDIRGAARALTLDDVGAFQLSVPPAVISGGRKFFVLGLLR